MLYVNGFQEEKEGKREEEENDDDSGGSDEKESDTESEDKESSGNDSNGGNNSDTPKRKRSHSPGKKKPVKLEKKSKTTTKKSVRFAENLTESPVQRKSHKAAFDRKYGPACRQVMKCFHTTNRLRCCTWYNQGTCRYRGLSHTLRNGREVAHACIDCYYLAGLNINHPADSKDCELRKLE